MVRPSHLDGISLILICGIAAALSSCSSLKVGRDVVPSEDDWTQEGSDAQRTYSSNVKLRPPLAEKWVYNAGAGFGAGSPVVAGRVVLTGTRNGKVHAVRIDSGKKAGSQGFGSNVNGSVSIDKTALVIPVAWGRMTGLVGFDPVGGTKLWEFEAGPVISGVVSTDGSTFFVDSQPTVFSLATRSGKELWRLELDPSSAVSASPLITEAGAVVVASTAGVVTAMAADDGRLLWTTNVGAPVYTSPSGYEDLIVVPTTRGRMVILQAESGETVREIVEDDATVRYTTPAVGEDGTIVFGASNGRTWCADVRSGRVLWTHDDDAVVSAAPLLTREHVYVGRMDRRLIALERETGAPVWSATLRGRIKSGMAVQEEHLFVLAEPRYLYHFVPEDPDRE